MSETCATDAALSPQTADLAPRDTKTPQPSAKDQEHSRKARYRAAVETIREERLSLDEAGVDAAEKQQIKKELKQRKKTLDQEYKKDSKRLKEEQKAQSKLEKSARRKLEQEAVSVSERGQALPTSPQLEPITGQESAPAAADPDPVPLKPVTSQQVVQQVVQRVVQAKPTKAVPATSSSARK
ncbi:MAG: hypothetical protein M1840_001016 [Geoglossum simile]|nr:MAG: hypothetical protein M1840_001016 [Geoglossum simile]